VKGVYDSEAEAHDLPGSEAVVAAWLMDLDCIAVLAMLKSQVAYYPNILYIC